MRLAERVGEERGAGGTVGAGDVVAGVSFELEPTESINSGSANCHEGMLEVDVILCFEGRAACTCTNAVLQLEVLVINAEDDIEE